MKHSFNEFAALANEYSAANTQATEAKEIKTSVSNELAWTAVGIYLQGTKEDKESLKASIAKDMPHHALRGMVSKANSVAFYLLTHDSIVMGDSEVTLEALQNVPSDAIPSVTVNELYKIVNEASKGDTQALQRAKAIKKQALVQASNFLGQDISQKQFDTLPSAKQAAFIEEATAMVDAALAQEAKAKEAETREQAIARIVSEIQALGASDEVLAALTAPAQVKAA